MKIYRKGLTFYIEDEDGDLWDTHIENVSQRISANNKLSVIFENGVSFIVDDIFTIEDENGAPVGIDRESILAYLLQTNQDSEL